MKRHKHLRALHRTLRLASVIVPFQQREEWRTEWAAELSYMLRTDPAATNGCCKGMLCDAAMMRLLRFRNGWNAIEWREPALCTRLLFGIFFLLLTASMAQRQMRHLVFSEWGYGAFVCFVALALFSLPSTTVTSRYGAYEALRGDAATLRQRLLRWRFLTGKLVLMVLSAYLLAVEITRLFQQLLGTQADWLLVACGLVFNVLAVNWALTDQRERCPTCMRLLRHPARMGPPSWSLLSSCATEEMCDRGHGLLHQPVWQTSWFENARWLQLDRTWWELFHS